MKKKLLFIVSFVVIVVMLSTIALAASVTPVTYDGNDSQDQEDLVSQGYTYYKIDSGATGTHTVKFNNSGAVDPNGSLIISVVIGTQSGTEYTQVLSWQSNFPVSKFIVKGSDAYNVYTYPTIKTSDANLVSPINSSGHPADVSHVSFIFDPSDYPIPTPTPTATPVAPTATPVVPTATPEEPTATPPVEPTATPPVEPTATPAVTPPTPVETCSPCVGKIIEITSTTQLYLYANRFQAIYGEALEPQTVKIKIKQTDGWIQIETWKGLRWINLSADTVTTDHNVLLYNSPNWDDPTGNGAGLTPQTIAVTWRSGDGWCETNTWLGKKWFNINPEYYEVEKCLRVYSEPNFSTFISGEGIVPQVVRVLERRDFGWLKISTWLGDRWICTESDTITLTKTTWVFTAPDTLTFIYEEELAPETLNVLDRQTGGWVKVETIWGPRWILTVTETLNITAPTQLYVQPDDRKIGISGEMLTPPQTATVTEHGFRGWIQISTSYGTRWIKPTGDDTLVIDNNRKTQLYRSANRNDFVDNESIVDQTVKVLLWSAEGWVKISAFDSERWINIAQDKVVLTSEIKMFTAPDRSKFIFGETLEPQEVVVVERKSGGWMKLSLKCGIRWINLGGDEYTFTKKVALYTAADFGSFNAGESITPQTVPVIQRLSGNWLKVNTSYGVRYINTDPNLVLIDAPKQMYKQDNFDNPIPGGTLTPQTIRVYEKGYGGWVKVSTWLGLVWINLD